VAEEQYTAADLEPMFCELDGWVDRITNHRNAFAVQPGSSLYGDDVKTNPYHLSHAASACISGAVDHLHALRSMIVRARLIHIHALFSLARGAHENACTALWLLHGATRAERVHRRCRLGAKDIKSYSAVLKLLDKTPPRSDVERLAELRDIAIRAGVPEDQALRRLSTGEIVETVGETFDGPNFAMFVWRACSGMAHADMWATLGLLERTEVIPGVGVGNMINAKTQVPKTVVTATVSSVRSTVALAWRTYQQRATNHVTAQAASH
jgi:hypothetical protein